MKNTLINSILFVFTLGLIDTASFVAGSYLKKKGVFYNIPDISNFTKYLEDRDPILGWPSKSHLSERYDAEGSRPIPAFPDPKIPACASLYGDSFTWGDHVSDEHSIANIISRKLNCRVSNFGVSGYGTDQIFLRFKHNNDEAPIVVLNHFSGDIRRNVTRLRNLMADSNSQYILLKPRFIVKNGLLELIPLITPSKAEIECLAQSPETCLDNEYFLPGGPSGVQYLKFPFTWSLGKALKNEHLQAKINGIPVWKKFYDPEHVSNALDVTTKIIVEFSKLAKERNKTPIIAFTANAHDLEYFRKTGSWTFQPLIDGLKNVGVESINLGINLDEYLRKHEKDVCEIGNENCYGHFTEEGNEQMAVALIKEITKIVK